MLPLACIIAWQRGSMPRGSQQGLRSISSPCGFFSALFCPLLSTGQQRINARDKGTRHKPKRNESDFFPGQNCWLFFRFETITTVRIFFRAGYLSVH